jgi:stage V sporulation protein B
MYLKKALRGTIVVLVFSFFSGLLWYLLRMLLARRLTVAEFGIFYAMLAFFSFLSIFVDLGLAQAISKHVVWLNIKKRYEKIKGILLISLKLQLFISFVIILLLTLSSSFLAKNYFHYDIKYEFILFCLWFLSLPLISFFAHLFLGFQKFTNLASIDSFRALFILILAFFFLNNNMSVMGVVLAFVIANFLIIIIYFPSIRKTFPSFFSVKKVVSRKEFKGVLVQGFFLSITSLVWSLLTQTDSLMLIYFGNAEQVGFYQIAVPIASIAIYLINALNIVAYPLASELFLKKKLKELGAGMSLFYKYIFVLIVPLVVILFSYGSFIITLFFGQKFTPAYSALQILAIGTIFSSVTLFNNLIISAIGKPEKATKIMIYVVILNVVLNFILIPKFGIVGAAIATTFSFIFAVIVSSYILGKYVSIKIPLKSWFLTIILGILTVFLIHFLNDLINLTLWFKLAVIGISAAAFYILTGTLFRVISLKEIRYLINLVVKK